MAQFKKGDWVECVVAYGPNLTLGKLYRCVSDERKTRSGKRVTIIGDNGKDFDSFAMRFQLSEYLPKDNTTLSDFDKVRLETAVGIMAATQSDDTFAALLSADTLITHIMAHPWKQTYD